MVKGVLVKQVVACASPGWTHEHGIELLIRITGRKSQTVLARVICSYHVCLLIAFHLKEVSLKHLKVNIFTQAIDIGIVPDVVNLQWLNLYANTVAVESKLDDIASHAPECIEHIDSLFLSLRVTFVIFAE